MSVPFVEPSPSTGVRIRQMQWSVLGWIKDHQLLAENYWDDGRGARWVIGQPHTYIHRCEIIAGIGGSLVVHGDFDLCRFASYDRQLAWRCLCWMADCMDLQYYVAQKASIGMGGDNVWDYDEDVAKHDIQEVIDAAQKTGESAEEIAVLQEALRNHTEYEQELYAFLHAEDQGWDLWEHRFGRVLGHPVVTNHVLLNRCAWLLRAKYGPEGPPECRREER